MIDKRADALRGFCGAYQKGVADYRAAFLTKGTAPEVTDAAIADIRTFIFASDADGAQRVRDGVGWYDEGAALDVADVKSQLEWFTEQKMVKGAINVDDIIDTHFLPTR
jgi:NitT/TauT family transport system substrate-binding protein